MRHDTLKLAAWHDLRHLFLDEGGSLVLERLAGRNVNNVFKFLLVNALVVVHFSLVADSLESMHVKVEIEVTSHNRHALECF